MKNIVLIGIILLTLGVMGFGILYVSTMYEIRQVNGEAMAPTITSGDMFVIGKARALRVGDIVVYQFEKSDYVHRIVAGPGDKIIMRDGELFINGRNEAKVGVSNANVKNPILVGEEYTLKKDEYFMLGDNKEQSLDSRYFGPINSIFIHGVYMFTYWQG